MRFRDSLWDDSEPEYAPCAKYLNGKWRFVSTSKYREAGYSIKTHKLKGPHERKISLEQCAQAREMTREMVRWHKGLAQGRKPGTWGVLIQQYLTDEFSDFHEVRPKTQVGYRSELNQIEKAIGHVLISKTDYVRLKTWQKNFQDKGRSVSFIKKWFTHWGLALSHGIKAGDKDVREHCLRIKAIRSEMRIKTPPRRSEYITRPEVEKIVAYADGLGYDFFSLAVLIRFEYMLRGVDVYGQWEPSNGREGGIQSNGKIWVDGITWDMIDPDVTQMTKVISKTRNSIPEPYEFDLTAAPEVRRRLMLIPKARRTGPIIVAEDGLPARSERLSKMFTRFVRKLAEQGEVSPNLQIRDNRSGGITEAKSLVDPYTLQHAAQHSQQSTTDIYARGRSESANKVVKLRGEQ